MSLVVRLRIELADRPGSLADVAAVIGAQGGNILSIDAFDAADGRAVDEITVEVPDDLDLAVLRSQIAAATDAQVLSHQRARVVDPIVRVLRRAAEALDRTCHEGAGVARLEGEPTREEQRHLYAAAAGRDVPDTRLVEVFAATRYAAIVVRVMNRAVARGHMPADHAVWLDNPATVALGQLLEG